VTIIILVPFLFYALFLFIAILGSERTDSNSLEGNSSLFFSIIIPFRNEEKNLSKLILSIKNLEFDKDRFEVIFIDDHSDDKGNRLIENDLGSSEIHWKLVTLTESRGKKNAIKLGIRKAQYDIIAMTDADCFLPTNWLSSLEKKYLSKKLDLILGPIKFRQKGYFAYLQKVELAALMSLTSLSCKKGRPILGNAANMSFRKSVFKEEYLLENKSESGDDLFLVYSLKRIEGIQISFNANTIVETNATTSFPDFVSQRLRWASKSKFIKDRDAIIYGLLTMLLNGCYLGLFIASLTNSSYIFYLVLCYLIKLICDTTLVVLNQKIAPIPYPIIGSIILSIIYPFYSILIASFSLFLKPQWKGRRI
jgi:cellulose synthase/poly-beta-1,6-N-acetylglucosamine synthase-like glycosyltransferase